MDEEVKSNTFDEKGNEIQIIPRNKNGQFIKGHSGNPSGRNANAFQIRDFAKGMLDETFKIMQEMLRGQGEYYDVKPVEKLKLIFELWNRAEGKVPTQLTITQESGKPSEMNMLQIDNELGKVEQELRKMGALDNDEG